MKIKKKRLLIFPAIILVFAVAALIQSGAFAGSVQAADVGTASLSDAGDTVFIRDALFTIDGATYVCTGYTVGNYGTALNPTANVNMNILTPITKEKPLTGTLNKNIYICGDDTADMYVNNLVVSSGKTITVAGDIFANFLYGTMTADSISADFINFSGATVTFNKSVTDFKQIEINYGSVIKVNGDLTTTKNGSYYSDTIGVSGSSKLTVTGNTSVPGWLHFSNKSEGNFGGNVYAGSYLAAVGNSSLTVTGNIETLQWLDFTDASLISIGGTTKCSGLQLTSPSATFTGDVTSSFFVHIHKTKATFASDLNLTGNNVFIIRGSSDVSVKNLSSSTYLDVLNSKLTATGNVTTTLYSTFSNANVSVGGDFTTAQTSFRELSTVDIKGNLSAKMMWISYASDITVENNLKCADYIDILNLSTDANYATSKPKLTVNGDITTSYINVNKNGVLNAKNITTDNFIDIRYSGVLSSTGNIKTSVINVGDSGTLNGLNIATSNKGNSYNYIDVRKSSTLTATGNVSTDDVEVGEAGKVDIAGNCDIVKYFGVIGDSSTMSVGKNLTYNSDSGKITNLTVKGNLTNNDKSEGLYDGLLVVGALKVDGDINMHYSLLNITAPGTLTLGGKIDALRIANISGLPVETFETDYSGMPTIKVTDATAPIYMELPYTLGRVSFTSASGDFTADVSDLSTKDYTAVSSIAIKNAAFSSSAPACGETLSVTAQPDGATFNSKWYLLNNDGTETPITNVSNNSINLTKDMVGKKIRCELEGTGNYCFKREIVSNAISKVRRTISLTDGLSVTYTGKENVYPTKEIKVSDTNAVVTMKYQPVGSNSRPDANAWVSGMPTDAGKYFVCAYAPEDEGYSAATSDYVFFTINPYKVTLLWQDTEYTYNGEVQTIHAKYTDALGKKSDAIVTTDREFKNAGTYLATASISSNYQIANPSNAYTIKKAASGITAVYDVPETLYACSGALPTISYTGNIPGTITWNAYNLGGTATQTFGWTFTPTDTANYETVTGTAQFNVTDDHDWTEWQSDNNSGFIKDGTESRHCKICGETETQKDKFSCTLIKIFRAIYKVLKTVFSGIVK